jgi:4-hydroxybenzoate polyprenyltransferase
MNLLFQFLRLIRAVNLFVIALTMVITQYFLSKYMYIGTNVLGDIATPGTFLAIMKAVFSFEFLMLLAMALLFAAAANIINDYFDVRADRVNKPDRLIVDVYIKRRWAMVWNWLFNLVGLAIGLYLGYLVQSVWIPVVAFLTINLLWLYSAYFKRKPFTGNILVAAFIGFVPISVVWFNHIITPNFSNPDLFIVLAKQHYFFTVVLFTSLLAFLMNLIRELVKDVIDVKGDLKLGAKTFPIKYGLKKSRQLLLLIFILVLISGGLFLYYVLNIIMELILSVPVVYNPINLPFFMILLTGSLILMTTAAYYIFKKHRISAYKKASLYLKFAMVFGLLIPLFL